MKKIILKPNLLPIIFALLTIVAAALLFSSRSKDSNTEKKPQEPVNPVKQAEETSDNVQTVFRIHNIPIFIEKDVIWINWEGSETSREIYKINKEEYPKLFKHFDRISVEPVADKRNNREYVVFASESYSRGGFGINYFVIWDLGVHKIVYEAPDMFPSWFSTYKFNDDGSEIAMSSYPYWFNSSVTSSSLPALEYAGYDPQEGKFVLKNNRHQNDFKDLKKVYDDAADNCYYFRKLADIPTLVREFGGGVKCDDYIVPDKPTFNDKGFISVGQFESVRSKLSRIITGENIPMNADSADIYSGQKGDIDKFFTSEDQKTAVEYSQKESLFVKYPDLTDYVKGHYVFLVDMIEFPTDKDSVLVFQSYPVGCGSCGTRSVDYYYKGLIRQIDAGHEIHHQIITDEKGNSVLQIKYGILNGEGNSDYQWSMLNDYKWNKETNSFNQISSKRVPSPYSKQ